MPQSDTTTATPETAEALRIRPWPDPVIDTLGHDPRSLYVETFWLPVLGPTSVLLLRHLAHHFDRAGATLQEHTVELPVAATSQALGLGPRGTPNSPLVRTLSRLVQFDLAFPHSDRSVAVRRNLPPLGRRHTRKLPDHLRRRHDEWMAAQEAPRDVAERSARKFAVTLTELGNDTDVVEQALHQLGFQPVVSREAATWALTRRRRSATGSDRPDLGATGDGEHGAVDDLTAA